MAVRVLGVDLDNTIIDYDALLLRIADEHGWLPGGTDVRKRALRDRLRGSPDGEAKWTRLQALAYGSRIDEAVLARGFTDFLAQAHATGAVVHVISHKTATAAADPSVDLRACALRWMEQRRLFDGGLLRRDHVHFEDTRAAKVARIGALGCDVYIDDLEETFAEPTFPGGVTRILVGVDRAAVGGVTALRDWTAVTAYLFGVVPAVETLLGTHIEACVAISGGRNNRLYDLVTPHGRFVAKQYFRHGSDDRDRLASEFDGLRALRAAGIRRVPDAIAADRERRVAVYERIDGVPVREVRLEDVDSAAAFVRELRDASAHPAASAVGDAAEACFSLEDVIDSIARRVDRLNVVSRDHDELSRFLEHELPPALTAMIDRARAAAPAWDLGRAGGTPPGHRILSPSDFGFHNALRRVDGDLAFVDFEYFGWDDAVKMISDFVLQPVVELPRHLAEAFIDRAVRIFPAADLLRSRVAATVPLFAIKWALIFLNEFLPERQRRRSFVDPAFDVTIAQAQQLGKARAIVRRVVSEEMGPSTAQ